MKQRLLIFGSLVLLIALMIGLNAATYVQKVKEPDNEFMPNRSSFNSGSTGTQAYFTLLAETGRSVQRWQQPPATLRTEMREAPKTFVLIGPFRRPFTEDERTDLLSWVESGGRLVIIDREPVGELVRSSTEWNIKIAPRTDIELMTVDPADQVQMTAKTPAIRPIQTTVFTAGVNAVQPSRFASAVDIERFDNDEIFATESDDEYEQGTGVATQNDDPNAESQSTPEPQVNTSAIEPESSTPWFEAPVVHVASADRNLVVDVPYGSGQIVFVADPFIVANGGIAMADNAQFALNIAGDGLIVFDEYHHGFGAGNNRILEYFEGTPVTAMILQIIAVVAFVMFSRSRRFARPVPEPEPDRLSKLEYVGAMAELQQRTNAYDLAMENIFTDFRRRAAKLLGVDQMTTPRSELALLIADRTGSDVRKIEELIERCENIIHGEPTGKREMLSLTTRLREIEGQLRLGRQSKTRI